jgi:hypothetical protein
MLFAEPVTAAIAKNYADIIRHPMDLKTMSEKVSSGQYKSLQSLRSDTELMCLNALTFNKLGDEYWKDAKVFLYKAFDIFKNSNCATHLTAFGLEAIHLYKSQEKQASVKLVHNKPTTAVSNKQNNSSKRKAYKEKDNVIDIKQDERKRAHEQSNIYALPKSYAIPIIPFVESDISNTSHHRTRRRSAFTSVSCNDTSKLIKNELKDVEIAKTISTSSKPETTKGGEDVNIIKSTKNEYLTATTELNKYSFLIKAPTALGFADKEYCLVCGSGGVDSHLLNCFDCGEVFHSFCCSYYLTCKTEAPFTRMTQEHKNNWTCASCSICDVCGFLAFTESGNVIKSIRCRYCDKASHVSCLQPSIPHGIDIDTLENSYICKDCVFCQIIDCCHITFCIDFLWKGVISTKSN